MSTSIHIKFILHDEHSHLILIFLALGLVMDFENFYHHSLIQIVLTLAIALTSHILLKKLMKRLHKRFDITRPDNLKQRRVLTQLLFIERIIESLIWIVAISVVLMSFDNLRNYGKSLLVSAGVVSVIFGLAAQKSLGNLIAGFQIAFTQPIRIDDAVVVEGEWGWIEEVTLTYVVVRIWDKRRLVLPITYFVEKPFQNWTRTTAQIIGTVFLYVNYDVNIDKLRSKFEEILEENSLWDKDVKVLQVVELKDQYVELRALMSAENSPKSWDLRCAVREKLLKYISEIGGRPIIQIQKQDIS